MLTVYVFLAQYVQGIGEAIWKGLDERLKSISSSEVEVKEAADLAAKEGLIQFSRFHTMARF